MNYRIENKRNTLCGPGVKVTHFHYYEKRGCYFEHIASLTARDWDASDARCAAEYRLTYEVSEDPACDVRVALTHNP
jgi:hypothetical protein